MIGDAASVDVLRISWPSPREAGLLVAMGLVAVISHRLCIEAYRRVPASILAPLQYGEIFGSILLGMLVFGHVPDRLTALGTAIIVGSGLYVFHRERLLARRQGGSGAPAA
jgi:drug/metabolite transporter (DMT)-like permease